MTPLPAAIHKAGFELTLVRRVGRVAIYRQHLLDGNPDHDVYELILAQVRNTNHKGQPVDTYERYHAAESLGKKGWTFSTSPETVQELEQLIQKASCAGTVSRKNRSDPGTGQKGPCRSRPGPRRPAKVRPVWGVPAKDKVNGPGPVLELSLK